MDKTPAGKNLALLGYVSSLLLFVSLIFFIALLGVAILLNLNKNQSFAAFHHRQMFGIAIIATLISSFTDLITQAWLAILLIVLVVSLALIGFLDASRNQTTPLPVIGPYFQNWFTFIK